MHRVGSIAAVLVTAVVAAAGCGSGGAGPVGGPGPFVGYRWRVADVRHGGADVVIPASLHGSVAFAPDRTLSGDDSVNAYYGRYATDGTHAFHPQHVATTLVGWTGHDPARRALIDGVEAVLTSLRPVQAVALGADRLRLTVPHFVVTCVRLGPAPNARPASHTPSRPSS